MTVPARRFNITPATVYKWQSRKSVHDRSHTAHTLQTTRARPKKPSSCSCALLLPLDDLLAVTREFLCKDVSRSGLDRCLCRFGVGNLNALKPDAPKEPPKEPPKAFKSYTPGYLHMDIKYLPQMPDETRRRYLFVANWMAPSARQCRLAA